MTLFLYPFYRRVKRFGGVKTLAQIRKWLGSVQFLRPPGPPTILQAFSASFVARRLLSKAGES